MKNLMLKNEEKQTVTDGILQATALMYLEEALLKEEYENCKELIDMAKKETYTEGMYACRPPGMKHGPYQVPVGCITFEIRYYRK